MHLFPLYFPGDTLKHPSEHTLFIIVLGGHVPGSIVSRHALGACSAHPTTSLSPSYHLAQPILPPRSAHPTISLSPSYHLAQPILPPRSAHPTTSLSPSYHLAHHFTQGNTVVLTLRTNSKSELDDRSCTGFLFLFCDWQIPAVLLGIGPITLAGL